MSRRRAARRSLGQHFLVDPNIQRKIVDELEAGPGDTVLEVGPGHGELSGHLVGKVGRLVLIEKDRRLAADLRARWGDRPDVEIVEGDALELDLSRWSPAGGGLEVVSNVPYNITSPLLFALLAIRPVPARLILTVQKEVAERIVSPPGRKTYGALSVGVQAMAAAEMRFRVGRGAFRPRPDVDSAVVRIDPDPARAGLPDRVGLRELTRACFSRRRKQLQKIVRTAPELGFRGDPASFLEGLGLDPRARPEALAPEEFVALGEALTRGSRGAGGVGGGRAGAV